MIHGFVKVAAVTVSGKVADVSYNKRMIIESIKKCDEKGVKVAVFPEVCITTLSCGDLFLQKSLIDASMNALIDIADETAECDVISFIGMPFSYYGKLYNVMAAVKDGRVLGIVPKTYVVPYGDTNEARYFAKAPAETIIIDFNGEDVPFGTNLIFECESLPELRIAADVCEDLWVPISPSAYHAIAGATLICNSASSTENAGKCDVRRRLVSAHSAKILSGYIYCAAGDAESSTDFAFGGQNIIAECGDILAEAKLFENDITISEIDFEKITQARKRMATYEEEPDADYLKIYFDINDSEHMTKLTRTFSTNPFVPSTKAGRDEYMDQILSIQKSALAKRLTSTGTQKVVVGISGGLDSTLALLACVKTFDALGYPRENIITVTMPCFGTTDRTYENACQMCRVLKTNLREINIKESVSLHFKDIGHDENVHNAAFENAQARERTQILMDIANDEGGMVIGTGDLSELALGWATYNGDHMSMYGVNASIPKTLVRFVVMYVAETCGDNELKDVLYDVLDTPISPELLPSKDGKMDQKTEDIVGPYELHDFFLYYIYTYGFTPSKIYRLACYAFLGDYDEKTIYKWLTTFYKRFFSQQYKRSAVPDGPKATSVSLSPRGGLVMPSDAVAKVWLNELEQINP